MGRRDVDIFGGQAAPVQQKTGYYEIETPEQLLYLSGNWKSTDTNGDGQPDARVMDITY